MKPLTIRLATFEDAPELDRLNAAFNESSDGAENIARRLADPRRVDLPLLAEVDGQRAGFACLRVVPNLFYPVMYAELTELYVEPAFRRRGVGRALVAYAEALAREQGAHGMKILTGDDNEEGHGLYRAMGYQDDEETVFVKRL
jgi:GNAT superfamily N-acetyltransferase